MERTDQPHHPPSHGTTEPLWGHEAIRIRDALRALLTLAAPWPDGVIARYLTVGGATVDLTGDDHDTDGICHGCGTTPAQSGYISRSLDVLHIWAQRHAETCRAMPRPEAQWWDPQPPGPTSPARPGRTKPHPR